MARRAVIEALIRKESWRSFSLISSQWECRKAISSSKCWYINITNDRDFSSRRRDDCQNCSRDEKISSPHSVVNEDSKEQLQTINLTISDVSKTEKGVGQTTNMVFGSTVIDGSTGEWLTLDQKANAYPSVRRFTAIGTGGDDFVKSMIVVVESIIHCSIPQGHVKQRVSSGGKYVSVNIGPVCVISSEQVQDVYSAMRNDDRMKFFL